jgi:hypothetical protein
MILDEHCPIPPSAQALGFIFDVAQSDALSYVSVILDDLKASLHYNAAVMVVDKDEDDSRMDVGLQ